MASICVNDGRYKYEHDRAPRGFGLWAFKIGKEKELRWYHAMYSEAKKQAIAEAKRLGECIVTVMP